MSSMIKSCLQMGWSCPFMGIESWRELDDEFLDFNGSITFKLDEISTEGLDLVSKIVPNAKIHISNENFIYTQENIKKLMEMRDYLKEKYNKELEFPLTQKNFFDKTEVEVWSIDKVVNANSKLQTWADKINNATIDGRKLSQFEKYLFAYQIVTRYEYKSEDFRSEASDLSRTLVGILNSDKIVCVGYAELLSQLCEMIGIKCYEQSVACDGLNIDHSTCCVNIEDDLYDIHGIYYADPCWDSKQEEIESTLQHSLLPFDELDKGFIKYPISVDVDSVTKLFENKKLKHYSKEEIIERAFKIATDEGIQSLSDSIIKLREELDVGFEGQNESSSERLVDKLRDILGDCRKYYKLPIDKIIETMPSKDEKDWRKAFERKDWEKLMSKHSNQELIESFAIIQMLNQCGYNPFSRFDFELSEIDFSNLKKIKHPTHVTKENYLDALINVNMALGCTYEQAEAKALQKWNTSIEQIDGYQKVNDGFSTAFIEEAKTIEHSV